LRLVIVTMYLVLVTMLSVIITETFQMRLSIYGKEHTRMLND